MGVDCHQADAPGLGGLLAMPQRLGDPPMRMGGGIRGDIAKVGHPLGSGQGLAEHGDPMRAPAALELLARHPALDLSFGQEGGLIGLRLIRIFDSIQARRQVECFSQSARPGQSAADALIELGLVPKPFEGRNELELGGHNFSRRSRERLPALGSADLRAVGPILR
jgi:hypothetical protein